MGRRRQELGLTQRELEVVELLAQGKSTEDIAADLAIARTTARNHIQSIRRQIPSLANRQPETYRWPDGVLARS